MLRQNHLRRTLERLKGSYPEHSTAIQTVLDSPAGMSQLHDKVISDLPSPFSGHPILDWLWAHKAQIIQFILTIVATLVVGS